MEQRDVRGNPQGYRSAIGGAGKRDDPGRTPHPGKSDIADAAQKARARKKETKRANDGICPFFDRKNRGVIPAKAL